MRRMIGKPRALLGIVLLLAVGLPGRAWAQLKTGAERIDQAKKDSRFHIELLYFTPTFQLKDFGVDTNIFNEGDAPKKDFTFTATPGIHLVAPMAHRLLFTSDVGIDLVYYKTYATERSVNPSMTTRTEFYTPKFMPFLEASHVSSKQRQNLEIDLRARRKENAVTAGIAYSLSARTAVELSTGKRTYRFDGDDFFLGSSLQTTLDRDSTNYAVTVRSQRTVLTQLVLRMDVTHDRFVYLPERDADIVNILPSVKFEPRAIINGEGMLGFKRFKTLSPAIPDYSGLVSKIDLAYTLFGATKFGAKFQHDVDYSFDSRQSFYLINGGGVNVRRQLFRGNDAIVSFERYGYDYQQVQLLAVGQSDPHEVSKTFSFDVGHRLQRGGRVGFAMTHVSRNSNFNTGRMYDGWRYGVTYVYGK